MPTTFSPTLFNILTFILGGAFSMAVGWKVMKELVSSYRDQVRQLRGERDDYKQQLHDEKGLRQVDVLRLSELEARPNLINLETLLKDHTSAVVKIGQSLDSHISSDKRIFDSIEKSMKKIATRLSVK